MLRMKSKDLVSILVYLALLNCLLIRAESLDQNESKVNETTKKPERVVSLSLERPASTPSSLATSTYKIEENDENALDATRRNRFRKKKKTTTKNPKLEDSEEIQNEIEESSDLLRELSARKNQKRPGQIEWSREEEAEEDEDSGPGMPGRRWPLKQFGRSKLGYKQTEDEYSTSTTTQPTPPTLTGTSTSRPYALPEPSVEEMFDSYLIKNRPSPNDNKRIDYKEIFSFVDKDELKLMAKAYQVLHQGYTNIMSKMNAYRAPNQEEIRPTRMQTSQYYSKKGDSKNLASKLKNARPDDVKMFILNDGELYSIKL